MYYNNKEALIESLKKKLFIANVEKHCFRQTAVNYILFTKLLQNVVCTYISGEREKEIE